MISEGGGAGTLEHKSTALTLNDRAAESVSVTGTGVDFSGGMVSVGAIDFGRMELKDVTPAAQVTGHCLGALGRG